jgi:hypothetical protein
VPEENCNMVPMEVCNPVSRVVPSLEPVTQCVDTPKEICEYVQINKRKAMRTMVKKWCGPKDEDIVPVDNENDSGNETSSNLTTEDVLDDTKGIVCFVFLFF